MSKGIDRADSFNTQDELNFLSCIKNSYGIEFVGRYYKPSSSSSYLLMLVDKYARISKV